MGETHLKDAKYIIHINLYNFNGLIYVHVNEFWHYHHIKLLTVAYECNSFKFYIPVQHMF